MAAITINTVTGTGAKAVVLAASTGSDTFTYQPGDILMFLNGSGATAGLTLTGSAAGAFGVPGVGSINGAAGYTTGAKATNTTSFLMLDDIAQYLLGTITVVAPVTASFLAILRRA